MSNFFTENGYMVPSLPLSQSQFSMRRTPTYHNLDYNNTTLLLPGFDSDLFLRQSGAIRTNPIGILYPQDNRFLIPYLSPDYLFYQPPLNTQQTVPSYHPSFASSDDILWLLYHYYVQNENKGENPRIILSMENVSQFELNPLHSPEKSSNSRTNKSLTPRRSMHNKRRRKQRSKKMSEIVLNDITRDFLSSPKEKTIGEFIKNHYKRNVVADGTRESTNNSQICTIINIPKVGSASPLRSSSNSVNLLFTKKPSSPAVEDKVIESRMDDEIIKREGVGCGIAQDNNKGGFEMEGNVKKSNKEETHKRMYE